MSMTRTERLALETAIKHLFAERHFNICAIDHMLVMTKGVPEKRDYDTLRLLHCVDYSAMPQELRRELPHLVARVVFGEPMLVLLEAPAVPEVRRPWLARLLPAGFKP